jgi:hypothetical protein
MHGALSRLADAVDDGPARLQAAAAVLSPGARRIIVQFREAGALTPESSQPFHPQSSLDALAFTELLKAGIISHPRPGRYFLDERALRRLRSP